MPPGLHRKDDPWISPNVGNLAPHSEVACHDLVILEAYPHQGHLRRSVGLQRDQVGKVPRGQRLAHVFAELHATVLPSFTARCDAQPRHQPAAPSPTAPRTNSVRASSEAPTASQAASSRATASQLRGLGHPRPGLVGQRRHVEHEAGVPPRRRRLTARREGLASVGIRLSKEGGEGNPMEIPGTPSWPRRASRGGRGDWPVVAKAASRRPPPREGWRRRPPGPLGQGEITNDSFEHDTEHRRLDRRGGRRQLIQEEQTMAGRRRRLAQRGGAICTDPSITTGGRRSRRARGSSRSPPRSASRGSPRGRAPLRSCPFLGSPQEHRHARLDRDRKRLGDDRCIHARSPPETIVPDRKTSQIWPIEVTHALARDDSGGPSGLSSPSCPSAQMLLNRPTAPIHCRPRVND